MTIRCTDTKFSLRDGAFLYGRTWEPDISSDLQSSSAGRLLLVHGLGEHSGRYDALARRLAEHGWDVFAWDHRGHGLSSGKRGSVPSEDQLLADMVELLEGTERGASTTKTVLLGHSMGGLLVARFFAEALRAPDSSFGRLADRFHSAVLSSPALQIRLNWMERLLVRTLGVIHPTFTVSNGLRPDWICSRSDVVEAYRRDAQVHSRICGYLARFMLNSARIVEEMEGRWEKRTLCLYSLIDRCVDPAGTARFCGSAPEGVVRAYGSDRLLHEVLNEEDVEVERQLMRFLAD
ncbi:lysophospholipase [Pirellulaceae bacterium SH467]